MTRLLIGLTLIALSGGGYDSSTSDYADCAGYGFQPGTVAYAQCLQNIDLGRNANAAAFIGGGGWRAPARNCMVIGPTVSCQ